MRANNKFLFLFGMALVFASSAWASATRSIDANSILNPAHTITSTLPAYSGTLGTSAAWVQETPSGTCNGATTSFTLANTPTASATVVLYLDGLVMRQGSGKDYTISSAALTLSTACSTGQTLWAVYLKQ